MISIKVGDFVKVIKANERTLHKVGRVVKVVNTTKEKLYVVEFEKEKLYDYYTEKEIAYLY